MKQEELDEVLRLHKLWLAGEDGGKRADLSRANLRGANLLMANLHRADLRGAAICGAHLYGAVLSRADLHGAYLNGADLGSADLRGAYLNVADLHRADLCGADLSGTYIRGADLREAELSGAELNGSDLRGADMRGANIDNASWPLWCGSLAVKICSRLAAQFVYHCVRACQSVTGDPDVVAFCNDPVVIKLANRFHRVDECGMIDVKEEGAI